MSIETLCSGCGRTLRVGREFAGRRARCPQCGMIYQVPAMVSGESATATVGDAAAVAPGLADTQPWRPASAQVKWLLRIENGRVFGPVPKTEIDSWVAEGRVGEHHEIRREDDDQWHTAAHYFSPSALITSTGPVAETVARDQPAPHTTRPSQPLTIAEPVEKHRGGLILGLGIVGLFVWIVAIVALVLGFHDLGRISRGHMDPRGRSHTHVGVILGLIGVLKFVVTTLIRLFS